MKGTLHKTAVQILKEKFKESRDLLVDGNYINAADFEKFAIQQLPEYDSPEGFKKIRNCWFGYTADVYLTRTIDRLKNTLI